MMFSYMHFKYFDQERAQSKITPLRVALIRQLVDDLATTRFFCKNFPNSLSNSCHILTGFSYFSLAKFMADRESG